MTYQMQGPMGARTIINGRECDYFAGCGYLGLQNDPLILQAAAEALQRYGLANAGGLGNNHPIYDEVTQAAQAFFETEQVLYFASGYLGNAILAQGLRHEYEHIFIDEAAHYSVWDGARTAAKPVTPFRHRDAGALAEACRRSLKAGQRPLVMSDGVFPVSGETAPAPDYLEVVQPYGGLLCLDDAHATGVLGAQGRGSLEHFGLNGDDCYTTHTLSKALGAYGGLIGGRRALIEKLNRHSTVQTGASLPPLPLAAAAARALVIARQEPERRQRLWANVARARAGIRALGCALPDTPTPILCLASRPGRELAQVQAGLFERGICVAHVRGYSSTPAGGALRIAIFATHTEAQIDGLVAALAEVW